jgi:hypothetical protein
VWLYEPPFLHSSFGWRVNDIFELRVEDEVEIMLDRVQVVVHSQFRSLTNTLK